MWPPLVGLMQFWRRPVIEERPEAEICPITHWPVPRLIHFNLGRIYQSWGQLICLQLSNSCLLYRPKDKLIIFNVRVRTGCIKEKRIYCNYKLLSGECGVWVAALWDRISACALLQIRNTHFADNNDGFFWRNDGDGDLYIMVKCVCVCVSVTKKWPNLFDPPLFFQICLSKFLFKYFLNLFL